MKKPRLFLLLGLIVLAALYFLRQSGPTQTELTNTLIMTKLPDLAGKMQSIDSYKGKPLIVNFWATWCPPCRKEIPDFVSLQQSHANVQFIGIALDEANNVRDFCLRNKVNYPILVDSGHLLQHLATGLPYTIVLDANGKIVDTHLGAVSRDEMEKKIESLLKHT